MGVHCIGLFTFHRQCLLFLSYKGIMDVCMCLRVYLQGIAICTGFVLINVLTSERIIFV